MHVEAGLGESKFFYSIVVATIGIGALIGSFSMGILVKYLPYWYLFSFSLFSLVLGSVLYAVSNVGWLLMVGEFFIGLFKGAHLTLSYSYASESSVEYVELLQERDKVSSIRTAKDS